MKIQFYGCLAEAIGSEVEIDAPPGCSVRQLRERLIAEHPGSEPTLRSKRSRACVDDRVVHDDHILEGTDSVAFLPPVSGG